jgi:hypothetical protein
MKIIEVLKTKANNNHYLVRYVLFVQSCINTNDYTKGRYEEHHICPKAKDMFPQYSSFKKNPWNCAKLTPRQHFIAHWILAKAYPNIYSNQVALSIIKKDYENRYLIGRLNKGRATVVDAEGNRFSVSIEDPRYVSGELNGVHKNTKWITNGVDNKHLKIGEPIPTDWYLGLTKKEAKYVYINNGEITKQLIEHNSIPDGWVRGRLVSSKTKQIWINDGIANKKINITSEIPGGWHKGKCGFASNEGKIYINDGSNNKLIDPVEGIPDGWVRGILRKNLIKGSIRITDGIANKYLPKDSIIPEGWRRGMTKKS